MLLSAGVNGEALSDDEFGFFIILLAVAGNETTRNAITHGMDAFFNHPEQWEDYKANRPDTTVDEIVRWATPVSRSEEHTSELQSLMRISYAVFCLQKKIK